MNLTEFAVRRARNEFRELGTLSVSSVMELNSRGIDAVALEEEFAHAPDSETAPE